MRGSAECNKNACNMICCKVPTFNIRQNENIKICVGKTIYIFRRVNNRVSEMYEYMVIWLSAFKCIFMHYVCTHIDMLNINIHNYGIHNLNIIYKSNWRLLTVHQLIC